jgi:hypothetical protein
LQRKKPLRRLLFVRLTVYRPRASRLLKVTRQLLLARRLAPALTLQRLRVVRLPIWVPHRMPVLVARLRVLAVRVVLLASLLLMVLRVVVP